MKPEYVRRITDACYVDYYLSSNDGAQSFWSYRMQPVHEASTRYVDVCDAFLVDSAFNKPEITNTDALDKAEAVNATGVMLEDVYQEFDATVEKLLEGAELADAHEFNGDIYYPLQAPHVDCWREIGEPENIALGGTKDKPAAEKVRIAREVRQAVGPDITIHGLGWGASEPVIQAVNETPELMDSIDASTALHRARHMDVEPGTGNLTVRQAHAIGILLEKCRRMSPLTDKNDQSQLSAYV